MFKSIKDDRESYTSRVASGELHMTTGSEEWNEKYGLIDFKGKDDGKDNL